MVHSNQHRHAFLIMAHNEFNVLRTLVELLDHERNDIFIHYDKKIDHLPNIKCLHSNLFVLDHRIDNRWGTVTQIATEYLIFEEAVMHGPYMYYHLLSGVDLPIKSMHEIHEFFDAVKGKKEFVEVVENSRKYEFRIQQYHFCVDKIRSKNKIVVWSAKVFGKISPWIQKCIGIVRNKDLKICYGSNWVSITDDLVRYLIDYKCDVINRCQYSKCADEIFLQTILWNSPFRNNLYYTLDGKTSNLREIEWDRASRITGGPHVFRNEDIQKLMASDKLFARKFSDKYPEIIQKIRSRVIAQP